MYTKEKDGEGTKVFLLDKRPYESSGHYWATNLTILNALNELNLTYDYISPSAELMSNEVTKSILGDHSFTIIVENDFVLNAINYLVKKISLWKTEQFVIFISWIPDFNSEELNRLAEISEVFNVTFVGISMQTKESIAGNSNAEPYVGYETTSAIRNFKILWVPEISPKVDPRDSLQIRHWIDFQSFKPAVGEREIATVSFFGQLSGFRGLGEILILGLTNPSFRIFIRGSGFSPRTAWRPYKRKIYRYSSFKANPVFSIIFTLISISLGFLRNLPNVDFIDEPFETEEDLNLAISKSGSIFICCKSRPGSGIVMKALASGVPVIWNGYEGNLFEILNRFYPEGRFEYYELFIPGRMRKKAKELNRPNPPFTWEDYKTELATILRLR